MEQDRSFDFDGITYILEGRSRKGVTLLVNRNGTPMERLTLNLDDLHQRTEAVEVLRGLHQGPVYWEHLRQIGLALGGDIMGPEFALAIVEAGQMAEPGPRRWRVEGLLPEGFPSILYGDGGQGKSYLALALATAVVSRQPFLGLEVMAGPVLYLDWELDSDEFARRAYQIARGLGLERPPVGLLYARATLSLAELRGEIAAHVLRRSVGLVVADSLGPACHGDTQAERLIIPVMEDLRSLSVTSLAVDHQAKMQQGQDYAAKTPFGSAYKYNLARAVWQVEKGERREADTLELLLRHRKSNFGPLLQDIGVRVTFEAGLVRVRRVDPAEVPSLAEKLPARERVWAELRDMEEATAEELAEATGLVIGSVKNALTALRKAGRAEARPSETPQSPWCWRVRHASSPICSGTHDARLERGSHLVGLAKDLGARVPEDGDGG